MVAYETVEQTLDRRADEAWVQLRKDPDWLRWRCIGESLLAARQRCMKLTRSKRPFGRAYTESFGAWLEQRAFKDLSPNDRAALLTCMEKLAEIEAWRAGLSEDLRMRYNHPRTVLKHFIDSFDNVEAAHSYTVLDDADPEFPALTDLEFDESKMAEAEVEAEDEEEDKAPTTVRATVRHVQRPAAAPQPRRRSANRPLPYRDDVVAAVNKRGFEARLAATAALAQSAKRGDEGTSLLMGTLEQAASRLKYLYSKKDNWAKAVRLTDAEDRAEVSAYIDVLMQILEELREPLLADYDDETSPEVGASPLN